MIIITLVDMIGRSFLGQPRDGGERHRARIVKYIAYHDKNLESNPERIKFLYS